MGVTVGGDAVAGGCHQPAHAGRSPKINAWPPATPHREVTQPPDWHGLVVWDFLFNAATTGLLLVAAVADLARPGVFGPGGPVGVPARPRAS